MALANQTVPRTLTPVSLADSAKLLIATFRRRFGREPTQNEAALLQSQLWLESGRGKKVIAHNVGNIMATSGWVKAGNKIWRPTWFDPEEFEQLPDGPAKDRYRRLHKAMKEKKAPSRFRAYPNMQAGYDDYIDLLARRFPTIVEAAGTGDPMQFAIAVRDSRYCPDCNPAKTSNSFGRLKREMLASGHFDSLQGGREPLPLDLTPEEKTSSPGSAGGGRGFSSDSEQSSYGPEGKRLVDFDLPTLREGAHSAGVQLWQKLVNRVLSTDEEALRQFQVALKGGGIQPQAALKVDSEFGPITGAATQAVQSIHGLKVDRVVGRRTWGAII